MAHFAKLDEDNNVLWVTPLDDSICNDDEATGVAYLTKHHNWPFWKKTSYNTYKGKHYTNGVLSEDQTKAYRANYAGRGYKYDPVLDIFKMKRKPFESWSMNNTTGYFEAPLAYPGDPENIYEWDEAAYQADNTQGWVERN